MVDQPPKVIRMISIMEPSWIETISMTSYSKQFHQSQSHRGLSGQINLGSITGGSIHKVRGIKQIITFRAGRVHEFHHRSHFSACATLVLPVHWTAKRSRPSADEASKFTGASSKSKLVGKEFSRWLQFDMQSAGSQLCVAQEKTQSDGKGHEKPSQASGDRLHFSGSTRKPEVTETEASDVEGFGCQKENNTVHRRDLGRHKSHNPNA